jgi:exopolyphosphatase/guanosine-5'-triphosphate,3'-diphosphate pyrophosphatase
MAELQELRLRYLATGWKTAIGSSGTVLAVSEICRQSGLGETDIESGALQQLRDQLLQFRSTAEVRFPGLSEQRQPVIAGGLLMLQACFETFSLPRLRTSPYALREGLLYDMLGRLEHRDPRDNTVLAFKRRYHVDEAQAERVRNTAEAIFDQLAEHTGLRPIHRQMLGWAANLHELGLSVSHSHYQEHSAYLVRQSDMPGFTHTEQLFLAALVQYHRREIAGEICQGLPDRVHEGLRQCLVLLRLACILCRSRDRTAIPAINLSLNRSQLVINLSEDWMRAHPLTMHDLQAEGFEMRPTGFSLRVEALPAARKGQNHA